MSHMIHVVGIQTEIWFIIYLRWWLVVVFVTREFYRGLDAAESACCLFLRKGLREFPPILVGRSVVR